MCVLVLPPPPVEEASFTESAPMASTSSGSKISQSFLAFQCHRPPRGVLQCLDPSKLKQTLDHKQLLRGTPTRCSMSDGAQVLEELQQPFKLHRLQAAGLSVSTLVLASGFVTGNPGSQSHRQLG